MAAELDSHPTYVQTEHQDSSASAKFDSSDHAIIYGFAKSFQTGMFAKNWKNMMYLSNFDRYQQFFPSKGAFKNSNTDLRSE